MEKKYMHEVIATAIIYKNGRYLITRRAPNKKRFPGMWTVPGGHVEVDDYTQRRKDKNGYWCDVLEHTLRREVKEEVGLDVKNIRYIKSMALIHSDGIPSVVFSCVAEYMSGAVVLQESETDQFKWVTVKEAKNYRFVGGIYDELRFVDKILRNQVR